MTTLLGLSDDALSTIFQWSCLDVVTLYLCGSQSLNIRMTRCCHTIQSSPSIETLALKRWPRIFEKFSSLSVLRITAASLMTHDTHDLGESTPILDQIKKLNPNLSRLELQFKNAPQLMTDRSTRILDTKRVKPWMVSETFPKLTSLSLVNSPQAEVIYYYDVWTHCLPPSLVELRWSAGIPSDLAHLDFGKLPRGLTVLDLSSETSPTHTRELSPDETAKLPRGLTRLEGLVIFAPESLIMLPNALKDIEINASRLSPQLFAAIPHHVTSIRASNYFSTYLYHTASDSWTTDLPRQLLKLNFLISSLKVQDIPNLPQDMTEIRTAILNMQEVAQEVLVQAKNGKFGLPWPIGLSSLSIALSDCRTLSRYLFIAYPNTLTDLRLVIDDPRYALCNLPPGLTRLEVLAGHRFYVTFNQGTFPQGLTSLTLIESVLAPSCFGWLPSSLRILRLLDTCIYKEREMAEIPRSIKELELCRISVSTIPALPPQLQKLIVVKIDDHDPDAKLPHIPQTLRSIQQKKPNTTQPESLPLETLEPLEETPTSGTDLCLSLELTLALRTRQDVEWEADGSYDDGSYFD